MEAVYLIVVLMIVAVIILVWLFKAKARENNVLSDTAMGGNKVLSNIGKKLSDRNQDIIQKCLDEISGMNRPGYIDDKIYCCIDEIALKEGRADLAPQSHETLSEWHERADIPSEYLELEGYLNNLFSNKHSDLLITDFRGTI